VTATDRRRRTVGDESTASALIPQQRRGEDPLTAALTRRERLGADFMYRMSHGYENAEQLRQLAIIELSIGSRWPDVVEEQMAEWVARDAAGLHDPDTNPLPHCPYCGADQPQGR
jgi:hypothetical protein